MHERRERPVTSCGEKLRRIVAARRQRRKRLAIAALVGCAAIPVTASALWKPPTVLVWNASASAPLGLYRLNAPASVRRGEMVVARTPDPFRQLAAGRHYLPSNVPLVKRVAAAAGDRVCAADSVISINGRSVATRLRSDPAGRPMPWWTGCRRLRAGEYFLLMDNPASFDGRYFGVTRKQDLVGGAVLLWAKPADRGNDD